MLVCILFAFLFVYTTVADFWMGFRVKLVDESDGFELDVTNISNISLLRSPLKNACRT